MIIDWFGFWLIFSGVLLFFGLLSLTIRFFHWLKFKKDLKTIKNDKMKNILDLAGIEQSVKQNSVSQVLSHELFEFQKEIDELMKDVCFEAYDRNKMTDEGGDIRFDFEEQLEQLLDGKILNTIKEKDALIGQKDTVILALEEKNKRLIKEVINKLFFIIMEKDKVIRQKHEMIEYLKARITVAPQDFIDTHPLEPQKKPAVDHTGFVNVNHL